MTDGDVSDSRPLIVDGQAGVDRAVAALRAGDVVAIPTETVYGLGADATNSDAIAKVFAMKGRPTNHPLIVHIGSASQIDDWAVDVSDRARALAAAFWPGPMTLLMRRSAKAIDAVTGGRATVGLRVPAHPVALELLKEFGEGVAAPSANRFGRVSPTTAAHVAADLGSDLGIILDGGPCAVGVESTIIDVSGDGVVVLRPGGLSLEAIADVLGFRPDVEQATAPVGESRAPGTLAMHYAPNARVVLATEATLARILADADADADADGLPSTSKRIGLLAPAAVADLPGNVIELEPAGDPGHYAEVLYARLRQADRLAFDVLVCVPPAPTGVGLAVLDRLQRAAAAGRGEPTVTPTP
jgi:L-threonylcarbamoyladenylate synthase